MKTKTGDCGCKGSAGSIGGSTTGAHTVDCQPCEIPDLCRNHYYKGKLLTARDFRDEQDYHTNKLRLHQTQLHGWGVVCGFKVTPHPYCPKLRVVVEAGFAVDACGREVRSTSSVEIALPQPKPTPPKEGCDDPGTPTQTPPPAAPTDSSQADPTTGKPQAMSVAGVPNDPKNPNNPKDPNGNGNTGQQPPDDDCGCDDPEPIDLYLCVRYVECESEFSKTIFDDCACPPKTTQPGRVCEGSEIVLYTEKPSWWDDALPKGCERPDCSDIFKEALECQCPPAVPCIPIAVIFNWTPGTPVTEDEIDNWNPRPRLVSTMMLDRVIHCMLSKMPTKDLTKIIDINWNHGDSYTCHEFMSDYIMGNSPKGLRIQFDSKVYSEAISIQSFQALVVFRPPDPSRPHNMEIAPVTIEFDSDETEWCRLRIDPSYAKRALDEADFDIYVSLKCNVVTGKGGYAVDGNFLALNPSDGPYRMEFPTGDYTPGGTFESWFSVRRAGKQY